MTDDSHECLEYCVEEWDGDEWAQVGDAYETEAAATDALDELRCEPGCVMDRLRVQPC